MNYKNHAKIGAIPKTMLFLVIMVLGVLYFRYTWIRIENEQFNNAMQIARSIEAAMPGEDLNVLEAKPDDINKPQYQVVKNMLKAFVNINPRASFAYIYVEKNGKIYFIADSEPADSKDYSPPGQEYAEAKSEYKQPFRDGKALITIPLSDRWGTWRSALVPIKDKVTGKTIAVFAMDFNAQSWNKYLIIEVFKSGVIIVLLLLAFYLLIKIIAKNKLLKYDISERRLVEEALQLSEEKFRSIFEYSAEGKSMSTTDGKLIMNKAFCQILGYTEDELSPAKLKEITHPDDVVNNQKIVSSILSGEKEVARWEKRYIHKNGNIVWVDISTTLLRDNSGNPLYFITSIIDITDRKHTEEALHLSEEKYRAIFENVQDVFYQTDFAGIIREISPSIKHFSEFNREELIGSSVYDLYFDTNDRSVLLDNLAKNGVLWDYELKLKTKTNKLKHVSVNARLVYDTDGRPDHIDGALRDISERRQAEKALFESKQITEDIINAIPVSVFWKDRNLVYMGCNTVFARDAGFDNPKDIIGKDDFQMGWYDQAELYREDDQRVIVSGCPRLLIEEPQTTPAGKTITIITSKIPLLSAEGEVIGVLGTYIDITKRKQAEDELREMGINYLGLFNAIKQAIYIQNPDLTFINVNQGAIDMYGYEREYFIGKTPAFLSAPGKNDLNHVAKLVNLAYHGQPQNYEFWGIRKDGTVFPKDVWTVKGKYFGENVLITLASDITERKLSEIKQKESEEQHRTILHTAMDGFWLVDMKGQLLEVNESYCRMSGYTMQELLAMNIPGLEDFENADDTTEHIQNILVQGEDRFETRHRRKDGNTFDVEISVQYQPIGDGRLVVFIHDITERKEAEEKIKILNSELEDRVKVRTLDLENSNKELEAFSYSVSHDLRAPLRGIDGWSQALLEDYYDKLDDKGRLYLGRVRRESQRMGELIDDLLNLSRVNRSQMKKGDVEISKIAKNIVDRLLESHTGKQYQFSIQPGLMVHGDAQMLEIALVNLFGNAFKFTGKTALPKIEFGMLPINGVSTYYLKDNGVGFDMEHAKKLFGAFQRMHKQADFPGSGIGLAIVQRIISRHGGKIWAESKIGEGAAFYFTLS
jgi:PAS domain S-box-containing protein